jgi:hypothetical protein
MIGRLIAADHVEASVNIWDQHVRACRVCLHRGLNLCAEGQYLAEDVIALRSAFEHRVSQLTAQRGLVRPVAVKA